MLSINTKEYIWIEKYRPKNIDDIVLPESIKNDVKSWIKDGEIPNLLLSGKIPGTGKTSLCHTIIQELDADALLINASLEPNIDLLRNKIQGFVSTASFDDRPKIVILDEADFLNVNSTQPALRGFIEKFSKNARFILTCNYKTKLIEPLRNRLIEIDYDEMYNTNKAEMLKQTAKRTIEILKNENVKYEIQDLKWLLQHFYPSNRKIINSLQEYSNTGTLLINKDEIDQESLAKQVVEYVLTKDFKNLKATIEKTADSSSIFSMLYDSIESFPLAVRPQIIVTIAKYQSYDSMVRDRNINSVACATEVMTLL